MRTARTFTICWSLLLGGGTWSRGVYLPGWGGVPAWSRGGVPAWSRWGTWSQGGVPAWSGGYLPGLGGCTCLVPVGYLVPGGCTCLVRGVPAWSRGVYLPGPGGCTCLVQGVYLPGPRGCTRGYLVRYFHPRGQNDSRLWKYYLAPNFVCER